MKNYIETLSIYHDFSYTSAMMSPIMNEVMSNDETTDDEKGRLIPDR